MGLFMIIKTIRDIITANIMLRFDYRAWAASLKARNPKIEIEYISDSIVSLCHPYTCDHLLAGVVV